MTGEGRVHFLGLNFDGGTLESAVQEVLAKRNQPFCYVVTPNVHHVVKLQDLGDEFAREYSSAWRVYCDSRVLSILARLCGLKLPVVTGSDLTARVVTRASELNLTAAVVGPSASDCEALQSLYPRLKIASYTPPQSFISSEAEVKSCIDFVAASKGDIVFLAVGMPQQEILAQRIARHPSATGVGLCIGASIDFLTGRQKRAPIWLQKMGLEWFYRLLSDPKRLARRYLVECPRIGLLVFDHVRKQRMR